MIKACVIGWPINHSRSPLIHGHWLQQHNLLGQYEKIAVDPTHLQLFLNSIRGGDIAGCNVTIPHKEAALAFVDQPDDRVKRIGALNTIWRENGKLHATSTDGPGFVANVKSYLPDFSFTAKTVTILGAGGSARALIDEMLREGADQIFIYNRTYARADLLAQHFGPVLKAIHSEHLAPSLMQTDLLINTTSQGMNSESQIHIPWESLKPTAVAADIVYTPLVTAFLKSAQHGGHPIVPGLGMLLHQAVLGFEKWFGVRPQVTAELYALIARDIDADYKP
jgi:shikimate dehydrogenase